MVALANENEERSSRIMTLDSMRTDFNFRKGKAVLLSWRARGLEKLAGFQEQPPENTGVVHAILQENRKAWQERANTQLNGEPLTELCFLYM